ncbi:MAG: DUF4202 domain-containing protein [Tepidisphaeraceae bacterium]
MERFERAIAEFDAVNGEDPNLINSEPAQRVYARRMTHWLDRMYPDAAEALRLAARSQHIRRWMIPRSTYPMNRAGYHRWRTALYSFHADEAEKILRKVGYDDATIARVRSLLKKEKLKIDPQMQALEDVICLVFLENDLADFAAKHDEEKLIGILRRTWAKMSPIGQKAAMELKLPPELSALIGKALNQRD